MPNDTEILFAWLFAALALGAVASFVGAFNAPEVREARAHNRAVRLAQEQPARRRRRMQRVTE